MWCSWIESPSLDPEYRQNFIREGMKIQTSFFFMAYFFLLENLNYLSSLRLCLHSFLVQILRIEIIESTYSMRNYSDRAKFGPS